MAAVHRACAQCGWRVPPAAKQTGPGEREGTNGQGTEPAEKAGLLGQLAKGPRPARVPSAPDNSSNTLPGFFHSLHGYRETQKPFARAPPRTRKHPSLQQRANPSKMCRIWKEDSAEGEVTLTSLNQDVKFQPDLPSHLLF